MTSQPRYSKIVMVSRMKVSASLRVPNQYGPGRSGSHLQPIHGIDLALDQERVGVLDVAMRTSSRPSLRAERSASSSARRPPRSPERVRDRLGHCLAVDVALET